MHELFQLIIESINYKFDNPGAGGAGEVNHLKYGEFGYLWHGNKSKITITLSLAEPICLCGKGFEDIDCDCEFDAFSEPGSQLEKTYLKNNFLQLKQQTTLL